MASRIKHKRSSVAGRVPVAGDLEAGELALNTNDGKVYLKKDDNSILDVNSTIFKNNTSVTTTDTGTDGTITAVADGTTVATLTSTQVSLTQNTSIGDAKTLQMKEATSSGTNYAGIKAPDSLAGNYTLTLPTTIGGIGQLLTVDGSGILEWGDADTFGGNRVYVSAQKGNDLNDGITAPVLTIKRALQIASGFVYTSGGIPNGQRYNVMISAGDYIEDNPIIVPDNVTVLGDSLRSVNIRALNANKDLLRVRNGSYFGEVTFRDTLSGGVPSYTFSYAVAFDDPLDTNTSRTGYTYLPATKPLISQSPYIQNVTLLSFLGGNGVLVDGNLVVTPNTPVNQIESENPVIGLAPEQGKSMVANAFTMLSFGGTGWRVINDAYVQIVSCFQIFMLNGTYTQSGGYCSITNSATNFGLYALRSAGFSPNAFAFDKGYIGTAGSVGSRQTLTAFGFTRPDGPVEEFITRIYNPSTDADLTSSYKNNLPTYVEATFDAATAVNVGTNVFTITSHGFNNGDQISYDVNGGTAIGGIFNGDVFWVKYLTSSTFSLCDDDSLTKDVDITFVGAGTQKFRKQDYEMFVGEIFETHNNFQTLTLATGGTGGYTFAVGDVITGLTSGFPNNAYVYSYNSGTRELVVSVNKVTIVATEVRNQFAVGSTIVTAAGSVVSYTVTAAPSRDDLYGATFEVKPTIIGGVYTDTATLPGKKIWFHRPSITNSSSHTWEYAGSGTDYNALPQNGGQSIPAYEQVQQNGGRVYTSGTNELGDFKVGTFITAYNRTGNVTFTNKITVDTLDVLKLGVGGVTVESISTDTDLGENEVGGPKDSRISTQLAVYGYAQNHLGNVLDKNVSTNAVPGSLVQLNSNGQINSDLIPTSRSFTNFSSGGLDSRLTQVDNIPANDMLAGDIATENFYQQELTLNAPITAEVGTTVIQTTGNTATTAIVSGSNSFTVSHSGAVTITKGTYILLEGVTPSTYNGVWLINRSSAGSFEVFSTINPGTATVQGTIYYGGASGKLKAAYASASSIIVASVFDNFNTPFVTGASTLIIGTDRTPSDTNTTVTASVATTASSSSANYFLRSSTTGQYLVLDASSSPTYTNGPISKAFRYNNNAYLTTTSVHNFTTGNAVKINAGTDSYDRTAYITVSSTTEFYYENTAADSTTSASTTATTTLAGATGATTMTGSVTSAALTGTITIGDFVFDTAGTIPNGSKITAVNMGVNPRTFTITFPSASTVAATTTATLKFFTPAVETGTVRSVIVAADSLSQGEFTEYRPGVISVVNNLTGLTGGTGYTNGIYTRVPLTNVSGTGVCALADITVSTGAVTDVDIVFGGAGYAITNALSASNVYLGGAGSGFQITVSAVEKRVYVNLTGGQTFVATAGAPDFVEHNSSVVTTFSATATVVATFDARSTGAGGGVDTVTNRITTLAAHGFTDGDPVQYNPGADPALGGLITNNIYYIKVINPTTVELYTNYNVSTILALTTSTGAGHTFTRKAVDIINDTFTVPGHGFVTGDAFRILGNDLPYENSVQISQNTFWFVGSVTTNSFTVHPLRADALSSIAGVVLGEGDLTATGSGTITVVKANIKVVLTTNTSSATKNNWNSLTTTNIDASNIISGIVATSRLATGTANSATFLRGDSTWSTAVKSASVAVGSVLSITGSGATAFYGDLTLDVAKSDKTGGSGGYSTTGVASFNTTQFSVGTGDSLTAGQVLIKAGVIDAGTLDTYDSSYFLNPSNLTSNVPVNRGGTNIASYGIGDILYASATTTLNTLNIGVADTVMTSAGSAPQWSSKLTIADVVNTNAATIGTDSTSAANVFNANSNAVNIGGDAEAVYIGSNASTQALTASIKSYTTSGSASLSVTANVGLNATITTVARSSSIATITTAANHGLTSGDAVTLVCTSDSSFNTTATSVTVTGLTTFTYSNSGTTVVSTSGSGAVYIGATGLALGTTSASGEGVLKFVSTTGVRVGMLAQGSTFIPAGTYVTGVNATRVYLSANLTGIIVSASPIAFSDTNRSLGINTGDQITIASSGDTNLNGTWPVTTAGLTSQSFTFKVTSATTQTNLPRAGTVVKESTLVIRNRNVTIGSSESSTSPVASTLKGENAVGTNIAGATFTLRPGLSTGNATGAVINFQTGTTGSPGDTTQTAVTRMSLAQSSAATTLDLTTAMTTANVFNTTATTVNFAGAGTTIGIGASTGTITLNNAIVTTPGQYITTKANSVTTGEGQIYLNGATGNRIDFNTNGVAAPTFTTRSLGTKLVLYPAISASGADYGFGIDSNTLWASVPTTTDSFKWYGGTTLATTLSGTGNLTLVGDLAVNGGDITTTATTFNLVNATATTVNFGGGATAINIGANASSANTITVGGAITGNTLKIASTSGGTINLTTDVTSGIANVFTSLTGTLNLGGQGVLVALKGATSGTISLKAIAVAGTNTITFPATTGTVVTTGDSSSVTNTMLSNSSLTVAAGTGMSGGGSVSLGGSVTLNNAGVTSLTTNTGLSSNVAATGAVTITNTGVTSLTTSSGLSTNTSATGAVSITNTGVTSNVAGTGITVSSASGAVTITNVGVTALTTSSGLSANTSATGAVSITNTGVTSAVAGTGIGVSGATGAVTITNNGVTSLTTSSGLSTNTSATGAVSITNTGVTSIVAGTNVSISAGTGAVTINVTGTVSTAASADRVKVADTRAIATTPQTIDMGVNFDFKDNTNNALSDGGGYFGMMTLRQYGTGTDWSGGRSHQLGFTDNDNVWHRSGSTTSWGTWYKMLHTNNASSHVVSAAVAGTGISVSSATGSVTISNTGVTSVGGTTNRITVSAGTGGVTISAPQDLHTTAAFQVGSLTIGTGFFISSVSNGLASTGSTQPGALLLTRDINNVTSVPLNSGVLLPVAVGGMRIMIRNSGANSLNVYPQASAQINSLGNGGGFTLPVGAFLEYVAVSATQWYTPNATFA
jgi:hypothetical protein